MQAGALLEQATATGALTADALLQATERVKELEEQVVQAGGLLEQATAMLEEQATESSRADKPGRIAELEKQVVQAWALLEQARAMLEERPEAQGGGGESGSNSLTLSVLAPSPLITVGKRRLADMTMQEKERRCAELVQAWWKGHVTRTWLVLIGKSTKRMREKYAAQERKEEAAARIQARVRGQQTRKSLAMGVVPGEDDGAAQVAREVLWALRVCVDTAASTQQFVRDLVEKQVRQGGDVLGKDAREQQAVVVLQSVYRGHTVRKKRLADMTMQEKERRCAELVQAWWKGHVTRTWLVLIGKSTKRMREKYAAQERKEEAAARIQARVRGQQTRKSLAMGVVPGEDDGAAQVAREVLWALRVCVDTAASTQQFVRDLSDKMADEMIGSSAGAALRLSTSSALARHELVQVRRRIADLEEQSHVVLLEGGSPVSMVVGDELADAQERIAELEKQVMHGGAVVEGTAEGTDRVIVQGTTDRVIPLEKQVCNGMLEHAASTSADAADDELLQAQQRIAKLDEQLILAGANLEQAASTEAAARVELLQAQERIVQLQQQVPTKTEGPPKAEAIGATDLLQAQERIAELEEQVMQAAALLEQVTSRSFAADELLQAQE